MKKAHGINLSIDLASQLRYVPAISIVTTSAATNLNVISSSGLRIIGW
jgi:hypothetical protein